MTSSREKVFERSPTQGVKDASDLEDYGFKRHDTVILHQAVQVVRWNRMASNIMNLPMDSNWTNLILTSSLINFFCGTTCFFFARNHLYRFIPIYVLCDAVYLFNVIILSLHRYSKKLNRESYTVRISTSAYVLDVISLLPQELIAISIFGSDSIISISLRWITYIRLRYLINFIKALSQVLNNRWRSFIVTFITLMFVMQHLFTCLIYEASCHHRRCLDPKSTKLRGRASQWYEGKWSQNIVMNYPYYEVASAFDWYVLSFYAILEMLLNIGSGNIVPTNLAEMIGLTFVMIFGYIFFAIWFLSFSFHMLTVVRRNTADFLFKIESIKLFLRGAIVSKEIQRNIYTYFNILWMKKDGVKNAPHFETLPLPLQMEIMYDINCAHLHRSLLFFDLKEFYLRTLSLFMRHEFLLPRDILYHQGVVKKSLVVITKGILEMLSEEDDESPIIAFQAGTVLGEACLFYSLPSKATVRAAVYTEVKLIDRVDFIRTISNYPIVLLYLKERINSRIRATKNNLEPIKDVSVELEEYDKKTLVPIKAFKDRLIERQKRADCTVCFIEQHI